MSRNNYWKIQRRQGADDVLISPEQAEKIQASLNQVSFIQVEGESIAASDIRGIVETRDPWVDPSVVLIGGSSGGASGKFEPQLTKEGAVKAEYVKKEVSEKEYQNYYSNAPGYTVLDKIGTSYILGFTHILGQEMPLGAEPCTLPEVQKIERARSVANG